MTPDLRRQAWQKLDEARLSFEGEDVGVRASVDDAHPKLNYDHCFVRDFAVCAPAFLLRGESAIVRRFLQTTLRLQSRSESFEPLLPRKGLMPASFRPERRHGWPVLEGDYGEESIARVTPVDSVFWWLLTLRAYTVATGDRGLAAEPEFQEGIRLVLELVMQGSFEVFPTLLVPEGAFMIDRRLGVYGNPLEVQVLFFAALRAAGELLEDGDEWQERVVQRLRNLEHHVGGFYWLDRDSVRRLREHPQDRYGEQVLNVLNIFPGSVPDWLDDFMPEDGGYFAGNVGPGRIDFRFFAQGNLLAVTSGLSGERQNQELVRLYEQRWDTLVGRAPLRIVWPALEDEAWRLVTGADEKNRSWSYHNGGSWPCLLWSFAPAMVACGRQDLLERAVSAAEERLEADGWPEYYEGRDELRPGERARRHQSWTAGAYLYARHCLEDPSAADLYRWGSAVRPEPAERERVQTSSSDHRKAGAARGS